MLASPHVAALNHDQRAGVVHDFSRARQHISMVMHSKLSFWRQMPWALCGLAHHDSGVSRACGQRAVQLWASMPGDAQHHRITLEFFALGCQGHTDLQRYLNGGVALQDLPHLEFLVARFRVIAVAERWIEARHSLTKRHLQSAPNASVVHVAFCGIQQPLRDMLRADPKFLDELAGFCPQTHNPMTCIRTCGLSLHPGIQHLAAAASHKKDLNRKERAAIVDILYHVDSSSLHAALPEVPSEPGFHV